jgi:hypothetical protein
MEVISAFAVRMASSSVDNGEGGVLDLAFSVFSKFKSVY